MSPHFFGLLSSVLYVSSGIPYIRSIMRGETTPNRASWGIWLATATINVAGQHASHAGSSFIYVIAQWGLTLGIFLISLKKGVGGTSRVDLSSLGIAGLAIVLWYVTRDPAYALYFVALADIVGTIPTLVKVWYKPYSENILSYALAGTAGFLGFFSVASTNLSLYAFPAYIFLINATVIATHFYRARQKPR